MNERPRIDLYSDTQTRPSRAMREADGERRGRRRAAQRGSDGARAMLDGCGPAWQGRGAVPSLRHHVQRDCIPNPHPARRRDHPARNQSCHALRGRRAGRALGRDVAHPARRTGHVHRRPGTRRNPRQQPALSALPSRLGREHHQSRRRRGVERGSPRRGRRRGPRARALHSHGRCAAVERGGRIGGRCLGVRSRVRLRVDRHEQGARGAGRRRARGPRTSSSRRHSGTSTSSVEPCARQASSPRPGSMP